MIFRGLLFCLFLGAALSGAAEVRLTEFEDRIRVEIDGKLFTE